MIFHSVGEIKRVFSYLSDDLELTEDGLRTFLAPFGEERYLDCNEWSLHEEGLATTQSNVKAQLARHLISPESVLIIQRNRQWLEGMSDEELACWLDSHIESCAACSHLTRKGCEIPNNGYDCLRGRLNWLRMEHKERKNNGYRQNGC